MREETLERLARLRSTISDIQQRSLHPEPAVTGMDTPSYALAEPARAAASDRRMRPTLDPVSLDRILRRRQQLDGTSGAAATPVAPRRPSVSEGGSRRQDVTARPAASPIAAAPADFSALRSDMSSRLDAYLSSIDAKVEHSLKRSTDEDDMAAALRDLAQRFDEETRLTAARQDDREARLSQAVVQGLGEMAERVSTRISDAATRAQAHLRERGEEMTEANRTVYEQILGGIGDLTDAVTDRLNANEAGPGLADLEDKVETLTHMLAAIERNVNDAPVLRRVERELRAVMDPVRGLEARVEARLAPRLDALDARLSTSTTEPALLDITNKIDHLTERLDCGTANADAQAVARIEQELATLQDLVWQASRDSEDTLKKLAESLSETRPGDAIAPLLAGLDARLDTLHATLSRHADDVRGQASSSSAASYAEEQIDTLVSRVEALVAGSDGVGLGATNGASRVEEQLADLANRVESYAERASQTGASRDEIVEAVQASAETILKKALEETGNDAGGQAAAAAVSEGLNELRNAHELGEKRTVDALETVRDTVERVFARLEQLEGGFAPTVSDSKALSVHDLQAAAVAAQTVPEAGAPTAPSLAMAEATTASESSFAVGDRLREAHDAQTPSKPAHDMPDDWAPVAPGQGGPKASTPAPSPHATRADFIAAARRAAQQNDGNLVTDAPRSAAAAGADKRGIRRILSRRGAKPALLVAAAVVLAVATLMITSNAVVTANVGTSEVAATPTTPTSSEIAESFVEPQTTIILQDPAAMPGPADANVARLDAISEIGEPEQFAARDPLDAGLLAPNATTPDVGPLTEPANAASVQSALAQNPAVAPQTVEPEPGLLASLPEGVGPEELRIAAASGDAKAQYEVARRLGAGTGVEKDEVAAVSWLERAAAQDLAPAQYRLGSLYEKGTGVEKDLELARAWYERAAAQGNARAMHNNGVLHAEGAFGDVDFEKAVSWFEQAAKLGVPDSQFNLGIIYGRGLGVPQDLARSYMWFDASAKLGDTDAAAKRDEVTTVMEPDAIATAKAMSDELVIDAPLLEANVVSLPPELLGAAAEAEMTDADKTLLIKQVQAVLTHRGYDVGPIDGIPGGRTAQAIESFREEMGLSADGHIDQALLDALSSS